MTSVSISLQGPLISCPINVTLADNKEKDRSIVCQQHFSASASSSEEEEELLRQEFNYISIKFITFQFLIIKSTASEYLREELGGHNRRAASFFYHRSIGK